MPVWYLFQVLYSLLLHPGWNWNWLQTTKMNNGSSNVLWDSRIKGVYVNYIPGPSFSLKKKFNNKVYRFIPINTSEPLLKIFNPLSICVDYKHRHTHAHPLSKKLLSSQFTKCLSLGESILSSGLSLVIVISFSDFWAQNHQKHCISKNLICRLFLWLRNLNQFMING